MFILRIIVISLNFEFCFCACARAEYKIKNECCPMCAPGNRVYWHCTADTSTTCVPCPSATFIDEPSGFEKCFPCSGCDSGQGLRVNKACTRTSNTACGPLDGFYCTDKNKDSCIFAVEHSKCSSGKYIKQTGTDSTDTVCADCTGETYSNGSLSSCLPHTKCEALGLTEIKPGTNSSDTECGNPPAASAVITCSVIGALLLLILICLFTIKYIRKMKQSTTSGPTGIQESRNESDGNASLTVGGRVNVEPNSLRLDDGQENLNNLERKTNSCLLKNDFTHSEHSQKWSSLNSSDLTKQKNKNTTMTLLL